MGLERLQAAPELGELRARELVTAAKLAPGYPGFEVEVEALNADPTPIVNLTVPAIVEHLESVIKPLETPPIIIGHSAGGVLANIKRGPQETWVDYRNENRAPLLFVSGSEDHIVPPSVQRSNMKHYKGTTTITEITEFEGPHFMPALEGWETIADHVLEWALEHARVPEPAA